MEQIIAFDADWQKPARTEQFVYECLKNYNVKIPGAIYIAFPWANLFDGLARETSLGERLLKEFKEIVREAKLLRGKRVVTACQHIKFKDYYNIFDEIGITDLFVSHKEKNQTNLGCINLYPLQLFPVQATKEVKTTFGILTDEKKFEERKFLYSFVGAYDGRYYLTDSRKNIFTHLKGEGGLITERANWHYQARVYDEQVYGQELSEEYLTEEQKNALEYINVLQDSKFSLCPSGTGPNSIRLWESIEYGSIPVILADTLDLPGEPQLWKEACVFINESEGNIKKIPSILKDLAKDEAALDLKITALKKLRSEIGFDMFAQHILHAVEKLPSFIRTKKQFILNCKNINTSQINEWLNFLLWVNDFTGFEFEISIITSNLTGIENCEQVTQLNSNYSINFNNNFVFLFDSKTITPALLTKIDTVFLEPIQEPKYINHLIYPFAIEKLKYSENKYIAWKPICTLITSMFNGDEYKGEFLENCTDFYQLDNIETLVCRPGSRGKEHLDLVEFGKQNTSLIYLWLAKDPGLYDVWNLGVRVSSAPYCSNANIDDKRGPEHIYELVEALDQHQTTDVGSTGLRVTDTKGQRWSDSGDEMVWYKPKFPEIYAVEKLAKFNEQLNKIVSHNIPHCMPVWRKNLHRINGYFAEKRFGPSSDWEFWLRCGAAGSQFYLLNKDLGLYYRAPQSYWRRDPNAKNYDDTIVSEYFKDGSFRDKPLSQCMNSTKLAAVVDAFRKDDYWAGISLLYIFLQNNQSPVSKPEESLLFRLCESLLEVDLQKLLLATNRLSPVSQTKDTFYDFIGFYLRALNLNGISKRLFGNLLILADNVISSENAQLGWLVKAKVYQLKKCHDTEAVSLQRAYDVDSYKFWCNINRLYGLEENLNYFLTKLDGAPQISDFSWLTKGGTLYYLPDYSHGNPYQKLLYQNFEEFGVDVKGLSETESLELDLSKFKSGDVLHIHWINILFRNHTKESISDSLSLFLSNMRLLKQKGIKVVWTVHNRQNHEVVDKNIELEFRASLSELCDVVLLHHPMIKSELSHWLHPKSHIEIIEHGLYENYYPNEISRDESRAKLGLNNKETVITTLGQIREYKNIPEKISVFKKVKFMVGDDLSYFIVGRISCNQTLNTLATPSDKLFVENRFINNDEVQIFLNAADYVLLSYKDILTSGSFFQASTFSKPVLAPNIGSLKYYVCDGVNGFIYSDSDDLYLQLRILKNADLNNMKITLENHGITKWPSFIKPI